MIAELPKIAYRPRTDDARILAEVLGDNEYRLPPRFQPSDVIVDIGGHIGGFALACLARGAGNVFSYEPDPDNYRLLKQNLSRKATAFHAAVWGHADPSLSFTGYPAGDTAKGTVVPLATVNGTDQKIQVPVLAIDDVLAAALRFGQRIRLLKLDCEGAEFNIVEECTKLEAVDEIVGEIHDSILSGLGWDARGLKAVLEKKGFAVHLETDPTYKFMHHFWAERTV